MRERKRGRERCRDAGNGHQTRSRRTILGREFNRHRGRSRQGRVDRAKQRAWNGKQREYMERRYDVGMFKQATTFFFTNIPNDWSYSEMWIEFAKFGRVFAIYSPLRRSRNGRRFGFVRYLNVKDEKELERKLDQIRIKGNKIWVNLAKHPKEEVKERDTRRIVTTNMVATGKSYADAVKGKLRAIWGKMILMECEDKEELKEPVQGAASWLDFKSDSSSKESWSEGSDDDEELGSKFSAGDNENFDGEEEDVKGEHELNELDKRSTNTPSDKVKFKMKGTGEFEIVAERGGVNTQRRFDRITYSQLGEEESMEMVEDSMEELLEASDMGSGEEVGLCKLGSKSRTTMDSIENTEEYDLGQAKAHVERLGSKAASRLQQNYGNLQKKFGVDAEDEEEAVKILEEMEIRDRKEKAEGSSKEERKNKKSKVEIEGWAGYRLKEKMKLTKEALRKWSRDSTLDIERKISNIAAEIDWIDRKGEQEQLMEEDIKKRREATITLWENMKRKESMIQQKSRKTWLAHGDANTKFFHKCVKGRWRRNEMSSIHINGVQLKEAIRMKDELADNDFITGPFSEGEIKEAVWECDSLKALGPDGFNFRFIKCEWELIKDDVIRFLQEFHNNSKMVRALNTSFIVLVPKLDNP
ncbi:hypothetical protein SLEP1_g39354 [Rubroshorea leprosula]|uniref:RRM domain-containing protein n=1 Tax=Rubroshorea leprosula TaxID=152421 RepID=A0AAV5KZY4_9ROSI|nr:hypothetical protein SLEP1_g39354 [Rubroshorea leprosula]